MTATTLRALAEPMGSLCVGAFYLLYFWRVFKSNPGNRFVECGVMTLAVFFAMVFFANPKTIPQWLFFAWLMLVLLLCFTTLFFLAQRGVEFLRTRQRDSR